MRSDAAMMMSVAIRWASIVLYFLLNAQHEKGYCPEIGVCWGKSKAHSLYIDSYLWQ